MHYYHEYSRCVRFTKPRLCSFFLFIILIIGQFHSMDKIKSFQFSARKRLLTIGLSNHGLSKTSMMRENKFIRTSNEKQRSEEPQEFNLPHISLRCVNKTKESRSFKKRSKSSCVELKRQRQKKNTKTWKINHLKRIYCAQVFRVSNCMESVA